MLHSGTNDLEANKVFFEISGLHLSARLSYSQHGLVISTVEMIMIETSCAISKVE